MDELNSWNTLLAALFLSIAFLKYAGTVTFLFLTGLGFTTFAPNHPKLTRLQRILYDAIRGVEVGALTPEEATEFFEDVARARLGDTVVVEP